MKTLKLFISALVLSATFAVAKADNIGVLPSKDYALYTYVNAICHGDTSGIDEVLDKNATFSIVRGKNVETANKAQMMKFLKENQNISQDCTVTTSVVDSSNDVSVVKVDMHYNGFTRTNYITIANTADGWRITNVHSVFKS